MIHNDALRGAKKFAFTTETQRAQRGIAATKSESRSSKLETNSNDQISNVLDNLEEGCENLNKTFRNWT
jgi:hypothetical protein